MFGSFSYANGFPYIHHYSNFVKKQKHFIIFNLKNQIQGNTIMVQKALLQNSFSAYEAREVTQSIMLR